MTSRPSSSAPARRAAFQDELPWVVAVACAAAAPLVALLATGHALAYFDSARLLAPMRALVAGALRSGRLPLWNPHEGTGMPLFAQGLHGVLHPWSLLAAAVAPADGVDLMIVLHVVAGAVGAGGLARTLGASRSGAAVAGIGYGLSGYLLSMARVLTFLAGGGTAPWAVAALVGVARPGRWRMPLAAIAVAVLHLAGDPQWSAVAFALGVLLAGDAGGWRAAGRAALAGLVGTVAAGIQLAPAWAFFARSARRVALGDADRVQWALSPWRLVELVAPGFFAGHPGSLRAPVFEWLGGPSRYPLPFVHSVVVGAPVLVLAAIGSAAARTGRLLAGAAAALAWMALGHHAGAAQATGWIPVWSSLRYSEKLVGPLTLALCVLAALGTDAVRARSGRGTVRALLALAAIAGLVSGAARVVAQGSAGPEAASVLALAAAQLSSGLAQAAVGLVAIAVLLLLAARARWRPRLGAGLAVVVLVQGLGAASYALHAGRTGLRDPAPLHALREEVAVPRVVTPLERSGVWLPGELDEVDGALWVQSRMGVTPFTVASGVDQLNTYTGVEPHRLTALFEALLGLGPGQLVALRRFSVTHAVVPVDLLPRDEIVREAAIAGGRRVGADPAARFEVWALPHRPWASFAERVRLVPEEARAAAAVRELEAAGDPAVVLVGTAAPPVSPGAVIAVRREPERLQVIAEAEREGLLVVNDAEWPGWEATVDGGPAPILLADGLVRAVRWPAGRHVLEMVYRPVEVRVGIALTALGLGLVLLLAFLGAPAGASTAAGGRRRPAVDRASA